MAIAKKTKKKISATEFRRDFSRVIESHLSKLSPEERHERITRAHALATKLTRGNPSTSAQGERAPDHSLVAHTHVE